jgi:DNA-binding MarR family transcriptional regulator
MSTTVMDAATRPAERALRLVPRLTRWAEARIGEDGQSRLSLRQLSALQMIEDQDTTLGDVARQLMVTPAVVTGLIDRLERQGFVRRVGSTSDRRRIHLELTPAGREAREATERRLSEELAEHLSAYSDKELAQLDAGLAMVDQVLTTLDQERRANRR